MFQQIEIIASGIAVIIGTVVIILQKTGLLFNKKSGNQVKTLELQIEKLKNEIYLELRNETNKAHETHVKIFEKLEDLSNTLSYLKGVMDKSN